MNTVVGTPTTPAFIEIVVRNHVVSNDGVTNKKVYNVFHYKRISAWTAETETQFEVAFAALLKADYLACLSVNLVGDDITLRYMDDPTHAGVVVASTYPGGVAGDSQPTSTSAYALMGTRDRGKGLHGSKHLGPIAEADTLNQEIAAGALARFATFATHMNANLVTGLGNVWTPIAIYKSRSDLTVNPSIFVYGTVYSVAFAKTLGTMRRRKEKSRY